MSLEGPQTPQLQQLIAGLNTRVTVASQDGLIQGVNPDLVFGIGANDAIREIRWHSQQHVMAGALSLRIEFPRQPVGFANRYFHIGVRDNKPETFRLLLTYPAGDVLTQDALFWAANRDIINNNNFVDMLGAQGDKDQFNVGNPLTVYPGGLLTLESQVMQATDTVDLTVVWEIVAAPLGACPQLIDTVVTEF